MVALPHMVMSDMACLVGLKDPDTSPEVRVTVRVRGGGLLPTTSHSIFYSRVGQTGLFSHCQPLDREDT